MSSPCGAVAATITTRFRFLSWLACAAARSFSTSRSMARKPRIFPRICTFAWLSNSSAGLARLAVTADGTYRVTVDLPAWIDVVSGAGLVGSSSFRGWHDCRVFKKSVEFALPARESLILQVSGARADAVKLVVTHVESEL